jgi:hypothetical protein
MSRPAWINVGAQDSVGSATVTSGTNTLTVVGHGLIDGDIVMVDTLTGGAVGPLISGAVYFVRNVAGNNFQLSGTRGSQLKEFASNGTAEVYVAVPSYNAVALRRNDAVTLFHGSGDGLGARQGVRPGSGVVISVAGTNWTVNNHSGVVYPGLTSTSGPYRYHQLQETDALDPADGTNDRVDALDLVIEDDDEDASGFRRSRVEYVVGTPGAGTPAVTANSSRLGTILVPSGGSPAPSVQSQAQFTVSSGGILPVLTSTTLPSAGRYEGMYADQADTDELRRWNGSAWNSVASSFIHSRSMVTIAEFDGGAGTSVTTVFSGINQDFAHLILFWRGRNDASNAAATLSMRFNGDGGTNYFSEQARTDGTAWAHNASANTTSVRVGFTGSQNGGSGKIFIPWYSNQGIVPTKSAHGESVARGVDGSSTDTSYGVGGGYWNSTVAITSIQLWPAGQLWGGDVRVTLIGVRG